jgi:hypothetical protein
VVAGGAPPGAGERGQLVGGGQAHEPVHDPARGVRLAEVQADQRRDEVELRDRHQALVQPADDDQRGGKHFELLHGNSYP